MLIEQSRASRSRAGWLAGLLLSWPILMDAEGRLHHMRKSRGRETASQDPGGQQRVASSPESGPRFPRPKILVIDAPDVTPVLQQRGYAAVSGSFGQPVVVPPTAGYQPLNQTADLPGYTEQEIVVADLAGPEPQAPTGRPAEPPGPGVRWLWVPTASGLVDPRPAAMLGVRDAMNRIYDHGGVFILFAAARFDPDYKITERDRAGALSSYGSQRVEADNWSLLAELRWLDVTADRGEEIDGADNGIARDLEIENYLTSGRFTCVVKPSSMTAGRWVSLATSKYGDPVAGIIFPEQEKTTGLIFILPQVEHRADLVAELIDRVLPRLAPRLFPHAEGSRWTRRPEYDLPRVTALKDEITRIEEATRRHMRGLEEQIEAEREQHGFLHDLLTATGDDLVQAVIKALQAIGFNEVQDVDADAGAGGQAGSLREDVRIMDAGVPVLVEVKGITGMPKEASLLQVAKYLIPRMRDWDRSDIHGLAVVNHQRNLPGLDREHEHVFQADVLSNAQHQGFGLLTTWDLFRLVRGFIIHRWHHDDIAGLFVTSGRIRPVPAHYEFIGVVDEYWAQAAALGLRMESGVLRVGDRIVYEQPVDFIEEDVTSLQLSDQDVEEAHPGDHAGLKTKLSKEQARKGVRVYRVKPRNNGS